MVESQAKLRSSIKATTLVTVQRSINALASRRREDGGGVGKGGGDGEGGGGEGRGKFKL